MEHPAIREKLFSILHSSYRWSDSLEVPNVGALNKMIVDGRGQDLILMQEALQEKNIGQVAEGNEGSGPQDRDDRGTVFVR